jgi:tetratricopeptide (TPR) repeat protein
MEAVVRDHPRDARAQFYLGQALQRGGRIREAALAYQEAARLDPGDPDPPVGLAALFFQIGADTEGRDLLFAVLRSHPQHIEALRLLGMIYQGRGLYQLAGDCYAQITRLRRNDADAWAGLGLCASQSEQPTHALTALRRAVALRPREGIYLRTLGRTEAQFGELEAAMGHLRRAVALDPASVMGHYELGRLLAGRGGAEQAAETELRRAIAIADLSSAHYELALLLESTGRRAEAARELERVLRREPRYSEARNALARVDARLGRRKEARAQWALFRRDMTADRLRSNLSHRLALAPNDADLHLRFARVLVETGDVEGARHEYQMVLQLQPTHPTARRELARLAPAAGSPYSRQP